MIDYWAVIIETKSYRVEVFMAIGFIPLKLRRHAIVIFQFLYNLVFGGLINLPILIVIKNKFVVLQNAEPLCHRHERIFALATLPWNFPRF
jgi:hypothetical protein